MAHGFYIEIIPHDNQIQRQVLPPDHLLVGRSPNTCMVVLDDPKVSRVHLRITQDPARGITVTDLHSANGTTIQGYLIPPNTPITWLVDQELLIGSTRLLLHYGEVGDGDGDEARAS